MEPCHVGMGGWDEKKRADHFWYRPAGPAGPAGPAPTTDSIRGHGGPGQSARRVGGSFSLPAPSNVPTRLQNQPRPNPGAGHYYFLVLLLCVRPLHTPSLPACPRRQLELSFAFACLPALRGNLHCPLRSCRSSKSNEGGNRRPALHRRWAADQKEHQLLAEALRRARRPA